MENGSLANDTINTEELMYAKASRGGIGFNDSKYFLVIANGASVPDLGHIFKILGATHALNLDGGGTSALYYNGEYKVGPGRLLPNAIVFRSK